MKEWYEVEVTIDGETFSDAIRGDSFESAYENAWDNWEDAEIIRVVG